MVPNARFELASCALQARAITRFANWASELSSLRKLAIWSGQRESNPHLDVGNVAIYH